MLLLLSHFSPVRFCVTPSTAAHQAPLSLGFSRQEYWRGLPCPSPMHARMLSHFSHVQLCATPWTAAHQAPPSMGFFRQEYWSGLLHFVSLFIFYILSYLPSKTMGCFSGRQMSAASDQKLFCELCSPFNWSFHEFVGEKVVSPSYSSTILTPPSV